MMKPAFLILAALTASLHADPVRIPAHTAYLEPDANGARISENKPITGWNKPGLKIEWFGQIKTAGKLDTSIEVTLPAGKESRLRLTVAGKSREAVVKGTGSPAPVSFGSFDIAKTGYQRFLLESLNRPNETNGDVGDLLLDGPAAKDAHFNLKERRNAASIHLSYPNPEGVNVEAFYCEATAVADPVATYYMVCGWDRGYFGMQVNSPTERRIIFSVWDAGGEAKDRSKVGAEDRTMLVAKGDGVDSGDFGNEGTGGHSHLVYNWKTGSTQRFVVTAKVLDGNHTVYSGFWFHPEQKKWMLISSWKAPKTGSWLKGLYSFSENFGGANGQLLRKCYYGNQWARTDKGQWIEITRANFSHDGTGKEDRLDRYMGVDHGRFFLSQGGFTDDFVKYGTPFDRPATKTPPNDLKLPPLPGM
ncbi:DUF3472 domain-containing protein [Luteolibacter ambystomatis]|uniref:DUF3472 domain-containing protein n=2 Tax=Luteolibacter ambystomatis TaxID=2824561 RepID=A0A975PH23_9BACT|nr:DUF3472 domain-containing protein [Luteolibacter ambystomatis]